MLSLMNRLREPMVRKSLNTTTLSSNLLDILGGLNSSTTLEDTTTKETEGTRHVRRQVRRQRGRGTSSVWANLNWSLSRAAALRNSGSREPSAPENTPDPQRPSAGQTQRVIKVRVAELERVSARGNRGGETRPQRERHSGKEAGSSRHVEERRGVTSPERRKRTLPQRANAAVSLVQPAASQRLKAQHVT
ncbi:hypothetical protein EYF80_032403 [Liparis tanakae]|uniref:Uncharacterized protein n=1 Tax=Liparis tanakae TaxID=230148 RepID=A0A4Z2GUN9_9TELE|nr:hypothetical protein EYF80_032403 [Liparis tanakae]